MLHSWLKYKEGFSADLVNILLDKMGAVPGDTVMDPFMGSGTTALVCQMRGINSIGYDILPISKVSIKAKANAMRYDIAEIEAFIAEFSALEMPEDYDGHTPYIIITNTAYPEFNSKSVLLEAAKGQQQPANEEIWTRGSPKECCHLDKITH